MVEITYEKFRQELFCSYVDLSDFEEKIFSIAKLNQSTARGYTVALPLYHEGKPVFSVEISYLKDGERIVCQGRFAVVDAHKLPHQRQLIFLGGEDAESGKTFNDPVEFLRTVRHKGQYIDMLAAAIITFDQYPALEDHLEKLGTSLFPNALSPLAPPRAAENTVPRSNNFPITFDTTKGKFFMQPIGSFHNLGLVTEGLSLDGLENPLPETVEFLTGLRNSIDATRLPRSDEDMQVVTQIGKYRLVIYPVSSGTHFDFHLEDSDNNKRMEATYQRTDDGKLVFRHGRDNRHNKRVKIDDNRDFMVRLRDIAVRQVVKKIMHAVAQVPVEPLRSAFDLTRRNTDRYES